MWPLQVFTWSQILSTHPDPAEIQGANTCAATVGRLDPLLRQNLPTRAWICFGLKQIQSSDLLRLCPPIICGYVSWFRHHTLSQNARLCLAIWAQQAYSFLIFLPILASFARPQTEAYVSLFTICGSCLSNQVCITCSHTICGFCLSNKVLFTRLQCAVSISISAPFAHSLSAPSQRYVVAALRPRDGFGEPR